MPRPQLWVVGGPNGAGKTTLVTRRVARRVEVVNPDVIAAALPRIDGRLDERRAGEIALRRRAGLMAAGADFAIETTLSGGSTLRFMEAARRAGYKVTLVYVGLASADLSLRRVVARVRRGGHAVPISAVDRRYPDTLAKLRKAMDLADRSFVLDNSGSRRRLLLVREASQTRFVAREMPGWLVRALPDLR